MIMNSFKSIQYKQEVVDVPQLGEGAQIIVREMSTAGLETYQKANFQEDGKALHDSPYRWMISLLVHSTVNENGEPLATEDDVPELIKAFPKSALDKLIPVITRVNNMTKNAVDVEKNVSEPAPENS